MAKEKEKPKEKRYEGYFLMDCGLKIPFDISEENGGDKFKELCWDLKFSWEKGDTIWLGEELQIIVDKIVGFSINDYEKEI